MNRLFLLLLRILRSLPQGLLGMLRYLETTFMDEALFLDVSTIQNLLGFLERQNPKPTKSAKFESSSQASRLLDNIWLTPSQWEKFSEKAGTLKDCVLENWSKFSEEEKTKLIRLSEDVFTYSSKSRTPRISKKQSLIDTIRFKAIVASSKWASFVLKRDVLEQIVMDAEDFTLAVLRKAQESAKEEDSDFYPSRVLILSDAASESFLRTMENPPKPSEKLIAFFSE